jgi:transcriptional regulator with XRE-family HTH domain
MQTEGTKTVHQGRNVKRIREILGVKQEALASDLGLTQQAISQLEQKEALDKNMLERIAKVLKVPVETIENFDEQAAVVYFNTFNDNSFTNSNGTFSASQCTFNPIDKVVQLYDEKIALYERMLKDKSEMIEKLEQMLLQKK